MNKIESFSDNKALKVGLHFTVGQMNYKILQPKAYVFKHQSSTATAWNCIVFTLGMCQS